MPLNGKKPRRCNQLEKLYSTKVLILVLLKINDYFSNDEISAKLDFEGRLCQVLEE